MANVNKVILIGNLTKDPEVRQTPKGTSVGDISIAINRNWTENGERREETTFVGVTLWGKLAEIVQQYARKGNPIYIEGRLTQDSWEDKDTGQKRTKTKVIAENVQLLGGRRDDQQEPRQERQRPAPNPELAGTVFAEDDDIPF